jgi:hypothetical protein
MLPRPLRWSIRAVVARSRGIRVWDSEGKTPDQGFSCAGCGTRTHTASLMSMQFETQTGGNRTNETELHTVTVAA